MPLIGNHNIGDLLFVTLRRNGVSNHLYHIGDEDGLIPVRLERSGPRSHTVRPVSTILIPFESLAPFIMQMGMEFDMAKPAPGSEHMLAEQNEFQEAFEDLIESEEAMRHRALDPSYKETWGETSISKERQADIEEQKEFGQNYGKDNQD